MEAMAAVRCKQVAPCPDYYVNYSSSVFKAEMTAKSSSVVVSPLISPLVASSLSNRRMIFPERVLGSPAAKRITSGLASEPIS